MKKQNLFDLTKRVAKITGGKIPIICGTQSFFAYAEYVPDIVARSIECDYLFLELNRETRNKILDKVGLDSEFRVKNGFMPIHSDFSRLFCRKIGRKDYRNYEFDCSVEKITKLCRYSTD